ncbi:MULTISPECIES: flagellar transcriptional regulator FlhD [Kosakonia]|uniref:Flagellar transcriptional regulator FlhD n=1 Tax=Kosakonia sacchari TaxID=1158459 RepID=A0ABZ0MKN0_9ENTR|nr:MULTISPECIES: flagellar transcriptional regulator FlhD [Kosakonia]WOZ76031.1 flagellar transcriptional regulator FlhD [Kosakonia sacchari]
MIERNNLLHEIYQLNLAYLLLVQRLANESDCASKLSNGLSEDMIEKIAGLTLPQLVSLAETNQIIVKPSFNCALPERGQSYVSRKMNVRFK